MSSLIGVCGYAGAGKDTVGEILVKDYGYKRVSFAGPLYEALYLLNPLIPTPHSWAPATRLQSLVKRDGWDATKRAHPEVRQLLQRMGTEVGRELFGENFWVDIAMREVAKHRRVVITDVRFVNELHAVIDSRGAVWRIVRPGTGPVNTHISDNALTDTNDLYSALIMNDGNLSDLHRAVAGTLL